MTADGNKFTTVNPLGHIEGLTSVTDRVVRKKHQQQQQHKHKKQKNRQIDQHLEEGLAIEQAENNEQGHIDFHA